MKNTHKFLFLQKADPSGVLTSETLAVMETLAEAKAVADQKAANTRATLVEQIIRRSFPMDPVVQDYYSKSM